MPEEHKPRAPHRLRAFWIFLLVLLAINWLSVLMTEPSGQPRVKIPFSPYFLQQVQAGRVKSISTKSATINGTFESKVLYPPDSRTATPTTLVSTQVPSFWNNPSLTPLLQARDVQVNAENRTPGPRWWARSCLGSAPRCCSSACSGFSRAGLSPLPEGSVGWASSGARRRVGWILRNSG